MIYFLEKYFLLLMLLFLPLLYAQTNKIRFEHITTDNGLSSNHISFIMQDKKGFLWISTQDGINRYDGYNFKHYKHISGNKNSLSDYAVSHIYEDSKGLFWISTRDGLNVFDPVKEKFTHFKPKINDPNSISSEKIVVSAEDKYGNIWIGTRKGLNLYNPTKQTFKLFLNNLSDSSSLSFDYVTEIFFDSKANLWIGTRNGLNKFDYTTNSFSVYIHDPQNQKSISSNQITTIFEDSKGNIWVGTSNGLNKIARLSGDKIEFISFVNIPGNFNSLSYNLISCIAEDQNGNLWIGTIGGGVNIFNPKTNEFTSYQHNPEDIKSVSENNIVALHIDNNNNVWVGTFFKGINLYNPSTQRFPLFQPNPIAKTDVDQNNISSILIDDKKNFWVATNGSGIKVYKKNTIFNKNILQFELKANQGNINSLSSDKITSIIQDREGFVWIGTFGSGLNRYDPINKTNKVFVHDVKNQNSIGNNFVHYVYEDSKGTIWVGTGLGGLNKFDKKNSSFKRFFTDPKFPNNSKYLNSPEVTSICEDNDGCLWIGTTTGGLSRLDPKTELFAHFKHDQEDFESISSNRIISIYSDSKGNIWIGTFSGGLNLYNKKSNSFKHFTEKDGLASNNVQAIIEDDEGKIWLTTSNGISKYDPDKNIFKNYDLTDGLQGKEFNPNSILKDVESGKIYFGGLNGLNIYNQNLKYESDTSTDVVITDFKIFNKSVDVGYNSILSKSIPFAKDINLKYDQNVITFEFASLDFTSPRKNNYAYMLDGFDKDWIYCGTRHEVTYTNLNPGDYIFKVKGTNVDGIWNEKWTEVNLLISPPFWQTWWAYSIYILLFLTGFYALRRYELNRVRLKNELKIKEVESNKLLEVNQIKSRFFANISHEFRTPLSIIIGSIENIKAKMENTYNEKDFTLLKRNASRLLQLINQLLELSKIESGIVKLNAEYDDIVKYLKRIVASFSSLAYQKNLFLTFNNNSLENNRLTNEIFLSFDKKKMETVFYNLLSNAIKFSPKGEMIDVSISAKDHYVEVRFINTGIEIASESIPLIFDRFYQVDDSKTRNYEGTGIGLSLVKEYIQLHSGKIEVESNNNKTVFTIYMPLDKKHDKENKIITDADDDLSSLKDMIELQQEINHSTTFVSEINYNEDKTIVLLVEDNSDLREMIKEILSDNYFVLEAENGVDGLKLAEQEIPDLIISDVMMPLMDGYEFSRNLKINEKTNHIPIIMLTAKAATEDKLEGLETGVDDYLIKPFNPDELKIRVKNLIKIRKQMREKFQSQMLIKPSDIVVQSTQKVFLDKLNLIIEKNISNNNFTVEILCNEIGMSRAQLHRKIKAITNQSTSEFIRNFRLQRAAILLEQNFGNIAEISYEVGFSSQAYFTKMFQDLYKQTPLEYKKQHSK